MKRELPKCFVSYCHDDADFDSIGAFEQELINVAGNRFAVLRDKKNVGAGGSISDHEDEIAKSCIVIVLFTPKYKEKVISRKGGVYREFSRIMSRYDTYRAELKSGRSTKTFALLPILFSGDITTSVIEELSDSMFLDFTKFRAPGGVSKHSVSVHREQFNQIRAMFDNVHNGLDRQFVKEYQEWLMLLFNESKHEVLRKRYKYNNQEEVLDELFVKTSAYRGVISGKSCILVGRKGSGKSTIVDQFHRGNSTDYKEPIEVIVDNFDLGYLFTFIFDLPNSIDIERLLSTDNYFEAVWRIFIIEQCILTVTKDSQNGRLYGELASLAVGLYEIVPKEKSKWSHFIRVCTEVKSHIDKSVAEASNDSGFLGDIADQLSIPAIIDSVVGVENLSLLADIIRLCDKKFIFALDGFDHKFEGFRKNNIASSRNMDEKTRRIEFEISWLRGLLRTVLEYRSANEVVQEKCDFCVTIPQDRFLEVRENEREDYRFRSLTSNLQWTGIELSILLRKRLEGLTVGFSSNPKKLPLARLDDVFSCDDIGIPTQVRITQQGNTVTISTLKYLLRHTFWRPRDVMYYLAAILANQVTAKKRGGTVDEAVLKAIVSRTTFDVIETEFIKEYQNTLTNIRSILQEFEGSKIILGFGELSKMLETTDMLIHGGTRKVVGILDKLSMLFEVGFLGVILDSKQTDKSLLCKDSFIFSDGDRLFKSMSDKKKMRLEYVIHPLFSEYLMLDTNVGRLVSFYTDEYLDRNDQLAT